MRRHRVSFFLAKIGGRCVTRHYFPCDF